MTKPPGPVVEESPTPKKRDNAKLPDAFSLFKPSWQAFKLNFEALAILFLLPMGLGFLAGILLGAGSESGTFGAAMIAFAVAAIIIGGLITACASIVAELVSAKGEKISLFAALKGGIHHFWELIGLLIVMVVIIGIGFLLLIVPGVFALQRLLLAPYFLLDQNLGIKEAIRASFKAGKSHSAAVWGVLGILIAISLLGIIPIVGWLVSLVLGLAYLCASAIRYLQIKKITA